MKAKTKFSKPSRARVRARGHFRELNVCEYRELYALCRGYARKWFGRHKMPLGDLDDIIVMSVHDAYERICRTREVRNLNSFIGVLMEFELDCEKHPDHPLRNPSAAFQKRHNRVLPKSAKGGRA